MIMAKLDPKFTEALMAWYKGDHSSDESIRKGAELLLQLNRNRVLYQQILRTPQRMLKKLEYEIKKHIDIRLDGYSLDDVKKMAAAVMPHVSAAAGVELKDDNLPFIEGQEDAIYPQVKSIGKRPDHDSLPEDIKKLWEVNAERWKKIKATFELCKTLNAPCDLFGEEERKSAPVRQHQGFPCPVRQHRRSRYLTYSLFPVTYYLTTPIRLASAQT